MLYTPTFLVMAFCNLAAISSYSCFFLFPLFIMDRGGTPSDVGILMGAFTLSSVICRPWIAGMIDHIGRKKSFTVGSLLMTFLPLFYVLLEGPIQTVYIPLLVIRALHGVGIAICATAAFTYAADIIPSGRFNEGIGMFGISGLTGLALGPVVSEVMIKHFGFRGLFSTASMLGLMALLAHLLVAETYRRDRSSPAVSLLAVLRGNRLLLTCATAFIFGFGLAAAGNFLPPFAAERHLTILAYYYISYSGTAVLTRLFGGRLADRVGESRIIPRAFLLLFAGLVVIVFLTNHFILALAGVLMGFGHGFLYPALNALAVKNESPDNRGKATGVFTGSIDAGFFAGSIALGYIAEWSGLSAVFAAAGAGCLCGYLLFRYSMARA